MPACSRTAGSDAGSVTVTRRPWRRRWQRPSTRPHRRASRSPTRRTRSPRGPTRPPPSRAFLALGAVALVVGCVGIANVMVIAVLERCGPGPGAAARHRLRARRRYRGRQLPDVAGRAALAIGGAPYRLTGDQEPAGWWCLGPSPVAGRAGSQTLYWARAVAWLTRPARQRSRTVRRRTPAGPAAAASGPRC